MIYRFKVWFEENDDIYRIIDVDPNNSFFDFFKFIIESISFNKELNSSFYISDDNWRKGKEINLLEKTDKKMLMKEVLMKQFINDPHQKMILITDFDEQWTLLIELQSIQQGVKGISYPLLNKTIGQAPKQKEGIARFGLAEENEMDEIASELSGKNNTMVEDDFDEEGFGEEGEESTGEESDEFSDDIAFSSEDEY